jgi:hypothetical protein
MVLHLVAPVGQHILNTTLISFRHQNINIELSLSLVGFLGQDMTRVRMTALDLPGRGYPKTLGRTLVCFKFRHDYFPKRICDFGFAVGDPNDFT